MSQVQTVDAVQPPRSESPDRANEPVRASSLDKRVHVSVTWAILQIGLRKQEQYQCTISTKAKDADKIQAQMRKLVDLNGKLSLSDKTTTLPDETIAQMRDLEQYGIQLLKKGEKNISPERIAELKAHISANIDRLKTELNTIFTTQIQPIIHESNSLLETIRAIMKKHDELMSKILSYMHQ